jgi:hypothetical protein
MTSCATSGTRSLSRRAGARCEASRPNSSAEVDATRTNALAPSVYVIGEAKLTMSVAGGFRLRHQPPWADQTSVQPESQQVKASRSSRNGVVPMCPAMRRARSDCVGIPPRSTLPAFGARSAGSHLPLQVLPDSIDLVSHRREELARPQHPSWHLTPQPRRHKPQPRSRLTSRPSPSSRPTPRRHSSKRNSRPSKPSRTKTS